MDKYIGVKIIEAEPMTSEEFNEQIRPLVCSMNDKNGYKVIYPDGYVSWSPKAVFDEAYHKTDGLTFGIAIESMKKGFKVARSGWNGKGMWIAISPGYKGLDAKEIWNDHNKEAAIQNGGKIDIPPYVTMKTADNKIVCGWLASQTDMLAEDWQVIE